MLSRYTLIRLPPWNCLVSPSRFLEKRRAAVPCLVLAPLPGSLSCLDLPCLVSPTLPHSTCLALCDATRLCPPSIFCFGVPLRVFSSLSGVTIHDWGSAISLHSSSLTPRVKLQGFLPLPLFRKDRPSQPACILAAAVKVCHVSHRFFFLVKKMVRVNCVFLRYLFILPLRSIKQSPL